MPAGAGWKPALPDRRDACPTTVPFMESPLSVFFRMHWDHEPETRKPFRIKASVFRFMERG